MAEDGAVGLKAAKTAVYDLILMDVQMPVMDGMEATRRIRTLESPVASVPIIGLTANAMAHQRADYLAAGMNGVAAKPISPSALLAEIARVMGESEARGQTAAA
jgi:CheY-like chemotaxis protein